MPFFINLKKFFLGLRPNLTPNLAFGQIWPNPNLYRSSAEALRLSPIWPESLDFRSQITEVTYASMFVVFRENSVEDAVFVSENWENIWFYIDYCIYNWRNHKHSSVCWMVPHGKDDILRNFCSNYFLFTFIGSGNILLSSWRKSW